MGRIPEKRMSPCSSPIVLRPAIRSSSVDLPASANKHQLRPDTGERALLCSLQIIQCPATKSCSTQVPAASLISPEQAAGQQQEQMPSQTEGPGA